MRLGIFGHVGNQNLGDEATIAAVLQQLRRRAPGAAFVGFTINPDDTTRRHGIPAHPIRRRAVAAPAAAAAPAPAAGRRIRERLKRVPAVRPTVKALRACAGAVWTVLAEAHFLARSYARLRGLDALLICGSGQLNDYVGGPWGYPWTLYKWTLLARLGRVPVMFLSVGAGPISSRLGRDLIRRALRRAIYRSYRDPGAQRLIAGLGIGGDPVVPDMAYAWAAGAAQAARPAVTGLRVGCCPLPYCNGAYWHKDDPAAYRRYVTALADAAEWLAGRGHVVEFYAMQLLVDNEVIGDIRALLTARGARQSPNVVYHRVEGLDDLAVLIASLDVVVPTRYHGAVLAYRFGKPVLSVVYHEKARELIARMGQQSRGIDIDALALPVFRERFEALERDRAAVAGQVAATLRDIVGEIEGQFDLVVSLIAPAQEPAVSAS